MKAYILISAMILALLNGTAMARDIEIGTILQSQPRYQEQIQKREEGRQEERALQRKERLERRQKQSINRQIDRQQQEINRETTQQ